MIVSINSNYSLKRIALLGRKWRTWKDSQEPRSAGLLRHEACRKWEAQPRHFPRKDWENPTKWLCIHAPVRAHVLLILTESDVVVIKMWRKRSVSFSEFLHLFCKIQSDGTSPRASSLEITAIALFYYCFAFTASSWFRLLSKSHSSFSNS